MKKNTAMKEQMKQKTTAPMFAVLVCAILLIASMFLPYITAIDAYKEMLEFAEQESALSLLGLFEYLTEDTKAATTVQGILAGLSVFTALFAILRLPVGAMIFDVLVTAATVLLHWLFKTDDYILQYWKFGIGHTLMFVACAGLLTGTIWMMVTKAKAKKNFVQVTTDL